MNNKNKISSLLITLIICICIIVFCISLILIIKNHIENSRSKKSNEILIQEVFNTDKIDWTELKEINEDIIGWIKIDNTNIDYPILKSDNDLYYLNHTYDKQKNKNGSIFIVNENINIFENEEINVYGHNMRNGNMFAPLKDYMDKEFLNNHLKIHIYTPACNYEGMIFSVFSSNIFEEENNVKTLEFADKINYYKNKDIHNSSMELENIKKIVKLITCSYINATTHPTEERYYIIAGLKQI